MFAPQFVITELTTMRAIDNMLLLFVGSFSVSDGGLPKNGI